MKPRIKAVAVVGVVVLVGGTLYVRSRKPANTGTLASLRTTTVQRGLVQLTASAAGTVTAPTDLSLNFQSSGMLTAVDVQPGQSVTAGQVLAQEDATTANNNLVQAKANLVSAQAKLAQLIQGPTAQSRSQDAVSVTQAQDAVQQAETSLSDTEASVNQDAATLGSALQQAQIALSDASASANQDTANLAAAVTAAQFQLAADQAGPNPDPVTIARDQSALNAAQASQQAGAMKDQQSVDQAQNSLTNASNAQQSGAIKDAQSLHQAQNAVTNARNGLASTLAANAVKEAPPLPGDLATAQAAVQTAQVAVNQAQLAVAQTTLVAPVAGLVASVGNAPGEFVSGGGTSSSASASSSSSSSSSGSSGSSKALVVLQGTSNLEVTAGFAETDAVNIKDNQPATISFNALPNVSLAGHVVEVDSQPTVVSNVVTYNVILAFDQNSAQVRDGMSANATVVVNQVTNVDYLPSLAIRSVGGQSTVSLLVNGKQSTVPISVGLQGDSATQILGGVAEGATVALPTLTTPASTGTTTRGGTGGTGGGGGFGGGGGLRLGG